MDAIIPVQPLINISVCVRLACGVPNVLVWIYNVLCVIKANVLASSGGDYIKVRCSPPSLARCDLLYCSCYFFPKTTWANRHSSIAAGGDRVLNVLIHVAVSCRFDT
ncbi:hypothetical protein EVAR_101818_1 [Eumeta japonica]|uniref:Uncharacterized protein n=1 Tax=Eumeta variegata TaxID=151549 RepID=A0A4C1SQJ2_EUMVA|nr:hypothetical protein EVAR_101818_1 [Eumeta japonica]